MSSLDRIIEKEVLEAERVIVIEEVVPARVGVSVNLNYPDKIVQVDML